MPKVFDIYYFDPEDRLELDSEESFFLMAESFEKVKLFVKHKDDDYMSFSSC